MTKELEKALRHIKTRADLWAVREVEQALSQEPCDDVISREMALKECHDIVVDGERYRVIQEETLLGLPPVTQKSGKWKVVSDGYGDSAYICECSECKDTVWVYKNADRKWNYCPNCGAKMESEDKA